MLLASNFENRREIIKKIVKIGNRKVSLKKGKYQTSNEKLQRN